jgi:coenzyme F420-reducing hydrogenase delta subunit
MSDEFEPRILAFCCNWCSYAAADLAGVSRLQYPPNARVVRVMCSGMVHPNLVIDALLRGVDGVMMCGCHPGDCHYLEGNLRAEQRAEAIKLMLDDLGLEPQRFRLAWVSASEGVRFAEVMRDMVETVRALGPSPYRGQEAAPPAAAVSPREPESIPESTVHEGKRYLWDGERYESPDAARERAAEYQRNGFEVLLHAGEDGRPLLYTRRVVAAAAT